MRHTLTRGASFVLLVALAIVGAPPVCAQEDLDAPPVFRGRNAEWQPYPTRQFRRITAWARTAGGQAGAARDSALRELEACGLPALPALGVCGIEGERRGDLALRDAALDAVRRIEGSLEIIRRAASELVGPRAEAAAEELVRMGDPAWYELARQSAAGDEADLARRRVVMDRIRAGWPERELERYCAEHGVARSDVLAVELQLVLGTQVHRYRVPADGAFSPERYVVLFVDADGVLTEVRDTQVVAGQTIPREEGCYRALFERMRRVGVKVTTEDDARRVLAGILVLDAWIHRASEAAPDVARLGTLTRRPGIVTSYRAVCSWEHGDDVGLVVDRDGYVEGLLHGHIR